MDTVETVEQGVTGWTAPGYEGVRDAFALNLADGLEVGAGFAAYRGGELVVDLWAGVADEASGRAWTRDTLMLVFSSTKGPTAMCAGKLAQEGRLDVEAPVVEYWPEFGAAGKEHVTVAHLLSHQAGLPWVDAPLTLADALAWDPMIRALEQQAPVWEPGTQHGYHAVTYGYLVGEVVRRITGRSIGTYFRDEIATPLGLAFWIGLPEVEEPRVGTLTGDLLIDRSTFDPAVLAQIDAFIGPETMVGRALSAGGAFSDFGEFNSRAVHAAEVPAAAGIGDARSLARMYAACIGDVDGQRVLTDEQLATMTEQRTSGPNTVLLDLDIQFGLGFMVPSSLITVGGPQAFGHFGAGGSMGWADPDLGLAFGYVMNRMDLGLAGDLRSTRLVEACEAAART